MARSLFKPSILAVGTSRDQNESLKPLAVVLLTSRTARQGAEHLRLLNIDIAVSKWELPDQSNGEFIRNIAEARLGLMVVAVIEPGNVEQEIEARSLGVSAVVSDDPGGQELYDTLSSLVETVVRKREARQTLFDNNMNRNDNTPHESFGFDDGGSEESISFSSSQPCGYEIQSVNYYEN